MDADLQKRLDDQDKKLEEIRRSVEKTRKYFLWTLIVTAVCFFAPLIGIMIVIPQLLEYYRQALNF